MNTTTAPDRTEAAEYYFTYIDQVAGGDICGILESQTAETLALLRDISDEQSLRRYAPDKWSIRQVVSHVNDAERLFVFRAFWFARGFDTPLPSFDQNLAIAAAGADERTWISHVEEFGTVRAATLTFFQHLPAEAWTKDPRFWTTILHPDDRERVIKAEARSMETGEPLQLEYRFLASDGREVWVHDKATVVEAQDGENSRQPDYELP